MNDISFLHGFLRCFMSVAELINISDETENMFSSDLHECVFYSLIFCTT